MIEEKICTKCGDKKPLNEFGYEAYRNQYKSHCKACRSAYAKYVRKHGAPIRVPKGSTEEKACSKCKQVKPLDRFSKRNKGRYYASHCKECKCAHEKEREGYRHPKARTYPRRGQKQRYLILLEQQGGVCAICGKPETVKDQHGNIRALAVDHNHVTGKVRGLLCMRCNTALGFLEKRNFAEDAQGYLSMFG